MRGSFWMAVAMLAAACSAAEARPFSSKATTVLPFAFSVAGAETAEGQRFDVVNLDVRNGPSDLTVTFRCALRNSRGEQWSDQGRFSFLPGETRKVRLAVERASDLGQSTSASCIVIQFEAPSLQPD